MKLFEEKHSWENVDAIERHFQFKTNLLNEFDNKWTDPHLSLSLSLSLFPHIYRLWNKISYWEQNNFNLLTYRCMALKVSTVICLQIFA